ncbi:hypothetical protein H0H93_013871 [Arthromyces matolae]|nr:hypothetical protein H0H93_013871 [Arthromyces matolae]
MSGEAGGAPREDGPGTVIYIAREQELSPGDLRDLKMSISQAHKVPMYGILLSEHANKWSISLYSPNTNKNPPSVDLNWMSITGKRLEPLEVIDTTLSEPNEKGQLSLYGDCFVQADKITKLYWNDQPTGRRNEVHFEQSVVDAIKEEIQAHKNRRMWDWLQYLDEVNISLISASRKPTPPPGPSQPKTPASLPVGTVHDSDGTCNINFFRQLHADR